MNLEILGLILLLIVLNTISLLFKKSNVLACGLVGFSGKGKIDFMKLKFLLFWNSVERGRDATGIYTPESGIVKDNVEARKFLNNKKMVSKIKVSNLLIGHVRAKTVGANSVANAHPFEYGDLVGAHNGSLKNHWQIAKNYGFNMSQYDVDSQVLISALNENHKNDDQGDFEALSEYEGAAALLIYNKKDNVLYACHDKERPLFYGYIKENMYISSIKDSLDLAGCENVTEFPVNTIHLIRDGEILHTIPYEIYKPVLYQPKKEWAIMSDVKEDNEGRLILDPKYSGISFSAAKPEWFVGYYVQVSSSYLAAPGKITNHKWYLVDDFKGPEGANRGKLIVTGDDKQPFELELYQVDTNNFIPAKGNICKMVYGVVNTKTKASFAERGDIVEVLDYKYGQETISLKVITTGATFTMDVDCVRNMGDAELNSVVSLLRNEEKANNPQSDVRVQNFLNTPTCDMPEYPFQDPQLRLPMPNVIDLTEEDVEVIEDDEEEFMIPYSTYIDLIDVVCQRVEKLEEHIDNFDMQGVIAEVEELKDVCVGAMEMK